MTTTEVQLKRRFKQIPIAIQQVLASMQMLSQWPEFLTLWRLPDGLFPDGTTIEHVFYSERRQSFMATIQHESFSEVPEGSEYYEDDDDLRKAVLYPERILLYRDDTGAFREDPSAYAKQEYDENDNPIPKPSKPSVQLQSEVVIDPRQTLPKMTPEVLRQCEILIRSLLRKHEDNSSIGLSTSNAVAQLLTENAKMRATVHNRIWQECCSGLREMDVQDWPDKAETLTEEIMSSLLEQVLPPGK